MKKELILFILFFEITRGTGFAQEKTLDSLKKRFAISINDTNKVNTVLELCKVYTRLGDGNHLLAYADSALTLSKKTSFKRGSANAYFFRAIGFYILNDIGASVKNDSLSLGIFKEIKDKPGMAQAYFSLGIVCQYTDNWPDAIKNSYQALKLYEESGDKISVASCLQMVGFNYYVHDDYVQSYKAFSDALTIYKSLGREDKASSCYIYMANIYRTQKRYKEAFNYDSIGLKIAIAQQDLQMIGNAYSAAGDIIAELVKKETTLEQNIHAKDSLEEALTYYQRALTNFKAVLDSGGIGDTYQRLTDMNTRLHRYTDAQHYADSALLVAKRLQYKDNLKYSYLVQARLDSATRNYKRAFDFYKKYIEYRDSISNAEILRKSAQEQMQYEFDKKQAVAEAEQDKKDAETKRIKTQQYFVIAGLGIIVLAVIVIAVLQYRNNQHKQKANALLQQQKEKVEGTLSELKSTQAQLIQSEKMASLGELTAGIAHEIQNPLNFVNNFSEVNKELIEEMKSEMDSGNLKEAKTIANDIGENEEKIIFHGKRADAIVKGMLQHSRTGGGQKEFTDLNSLCDEYLRLAYHGMRAKDKNFNAEIKTDFEKSIGKINIVSQEIGRVILNLINNAFYAVSEKKKQLGDGYEPTVTVSTKKNSDKIEIRVSDNGNGIPQRIADKIFQPFFTTKPTGQGTGLGLSLAYDIIKAHGGEFKVETTEGEGSTFVILLPVN